jgi:D-glycero-D-manno-heptose 1,7-bisphosphate phosphatase
VKRPAVFLDRDGTINEQMGYINHPSRFVLLPGVARAIRLLNENDVLAIVVSNQSGVARGYFPLELVHEVHDIMREELALHGAVLDDVLFCPHHPQGTVPEYTRACECRKPGTGMVDSARERFDIDMTRSFVVGDRFSDVELAHRCGMKAVLVETGYGRGEVQYVLPDKEHQPAHVAPDLEAAVQWMLHKQGMLASQDS